MEKLQEVKTAKKKVKISYGKSDPELVHSSYLLFLIESLVKNVNSTLKVCHLTYMYSVYNYVTNANTFHNILPLTNKPNLCMYISHVIVLKMKEFNAFLSVWTFV